MKILLDMNMPQIWCPYLIDAEHEAIHWRDVGDIRAPDTEIMEWARRNGQAYKNFIRMVDTERERFAHVFAVEGEWGRGKSRLGHELIAQINDCSRGWFVRGESGKLADAQLLNAKLFDDPDKRDAYLGLYIRYSQLASDVQSSDI